MNKINVLLVQVLYAVAKSHRTRRISLVGAMKG